MGKGCRESNDEGVGMSETYQVLTVTQRGGGVVRVVEEETIQGREKGSGYQGSVMGEC